MSLDRRYIMIHHSLTKDSETVSWGAIERYHIETKKWTDVAYHSGVELAGSPTQLGKYAYQAFIGRPLHSVAAACPQGNMNELALHVCCVGNFDLAPPSQELLSVLIKRVLLPWMHDFGIPPSRIVGHRDYNPAKSCPGHKFDLAALRARL